LLDYEQRAIELAHDRQQLAALRQRLQQGRETSLLFDMPRFVRSFEDAILTASRDQKHSH
jgi:predicted O-linked N-acetylglucosamine transferase (SPINDLY family)